MKTRLIQICGVALLANSLAALAAEAEQFDPAFNRIVALEQQGHFAEANKLCRELLARFGDTPAYNNRLQPVCARLNDEQHAANSIGFAPDSLIVPECAPLAECCFREAGDAGRVMLRKAMRDGNDAVALRACDILCELNDAEVQRICGERLQRAQDPLRAALIKALWRAIENVQPAALAGIYAVAKQDWNANAELARYLVAAIRRTGDDRPETVAKLLNDPNAWQALANLGLWSAVSTDALVVHFKFDEHQGQAAANSAPGGPVGELKAPQWGTGHRANAGALQCDGNTTSLVLDDHALHLGQNNHDFSLVFWFCLKEDHNGAWRVLTHKGHNDEQRTPAIWIRPDNNNIHYRISTYASSNEGGDSTSAVQVNGWTHIAYVKCGRKLMLFLNGKKDSEVELSAATLANTGPLYIGKDMQYSGATSAYEDYRIYARALTENEVKLLSNPQ